MNRLDFLRRRQSGLGGSDIPAILGINPWRTPLDVYLSKVEPIDEAAAADDELSEPAYWGITLEDVVAREYSKRTGNRVQRVNAMLTLAGSPLVANIDRAVVAPGSRVRVDSNGGALRGASGLFEAKTASAYKAQDWGRNEDPDAVPLHYMAQCQAYMAVTGLEWTDISVLIGGQRFVTKRIARDDETIRGIIDRADEFWRKHVEPRVPPDPTTVGDVLRLFQRDDGAMRAIDDDADLLAAYNELRTVRADLKTLEDREAELVDRLKFAVGGNAGLSINGKPAVTWRATKDSTVTDWKALAQFLNPQPDTIAQFTSTKAGVRRFVLNTKE
jgi:putative phage-type endonuclease